MDPPGLEPGFPARQAGVLPLDHKPESISGPPGIRTPISDMRRRNPAVGRAARSVETVGIEPTTGCVQDSPATLAFAPIRSVIPHGLEPWFPACETGVVASGPRDRNRISDLRLQIADWIPICNLQSQIFN
jgi:hypothetical protein